MARRPRTRRPRRSRRGWKKAGFKVTLDPLTETYYDVIQKPTADSDVIWGGWGADWPSIATVLPPLFDSRINLTTASNGQDYGNYRSDKVNKLIDEAASKGSVEEQAKVYSQIDDQLGKDVAYMPLEITRFYYLHGSKVTGYVNNPATVRLPGPGCRRGHQLTELDPQHAAPRSKPRDPASTVG